MGDFSLNSPMCKSAFQLKKKSFNKEQKGVWLVNLLGWQLPKTRDWYPFQKRTDAENYSTHQLLKNPISTSFSTKMPVYPNLLFPICNLQPCMSNLLFLPLKVEQHFSKIALTMKISYWIFESQGKMHQPCLWIF